MYGMRGTTGLSTPTQAILLGMVIIGCATAALITGHLSSGDWMTSVSLVGGGAAAVTGAHVGGQVANSTPAVGSQSSAPLDSPTVGTQPSPTVTPTPTPAEATGT